MMIADSKSPVVMTSKNGGRKYFMPNRPLATPDYSSDSLCSVENDDSDQSSTNDNNNNNSVNVSNGSTSRKNREHEVHDAHIEEEWEHGVIMSDDDDDHNNKIEKRESSNTCNYSYSYSSSSSSRRSSSKSSNINNNAEDHDNGENDVVVSNSVISSYQTSPLSFMSSFVRTNENSTTSTKKSVVAHTNQTPLAIGNEQETIDATSKLTDGNKKHEVTDKENENNDSQDNKHEYRGSCDSSNNNSDKNDHIHMDEEVDEKQLERKINDSKNNDYKEFAGNKQINESTNSRAEHEHEELDNIDDMENVITSLELPETENNCEAIREVFVHSGQDAPIKLHANYPPIERQPLYTHDDYMYSKHHEPELEEYQHQEEEQETEEETPPRLEKRKLSYKDKGHVEPLSPEQLIEPRHFTPMNVDKELHKNLQTKEHDKRPEEEEHQKELENTDKQSNNKSSGSKENANSSTTSTSSAYSSESSIHNNNNNKNNNNDDDDDGNENLKEMPSPYTSSSSSVVHSESTSTESSHASSSQQVETPMQAKELSLREQGDKEQERQNRNVVSSSTSTSKTSMSTLSSSSSSSSPLKVKKKKRVESITNVPDSRLVHKDQETNSNNTNENSHFTANNGNNNGVSYDKVTSDHKTDDERKVCVGAPNNEDKAKEETDIKINSELPAKVNKANSEKSLNAKHLQEQKQLEKQLEEIQAQKGSTPRTADHKQRTSVKERDIVSQVNIVNNTKIDERKESRPIDKNSNEEKADVKTNAQSTKTSKSESRIRIEPLRTNSHIANKDMSKNVTGVANDNETAAANTNSSNYKVESNKDHHDNKPNNSTKEEQNKQVLPSITRKSSKHDVAHSNNITTTNTVKQNSHMQAKANAATTASRIAEQTKNAIKNINTDEMSIKDKNNESMNTKHEHKSVSKQHIDHVHVERLGKLVSPEHNFTQVRQENSLREQRVNRLYELLDKPDAHHNTKRSNGKIKLMHHSHQQEQQQKQQQQHNQRLEREMQSKSVSINWKNRPHAQGSAVHMMRQQKKRHDHLSEEHLPTIVTEESGKQAMSIFLEPVADDMIDSKTYYFSVRAIPESGSIQNTDNSQYNSHNNVSTLPNLSPNRSQHLHLENPIINIVNHEDSNYLTRQTGNKKHVLSPLSRQRFRPYNITNARATVLPPVQTNKWYRPTNTKEQNRKKRKQRRLETNKPRLRKPLGLLDIPVLEITKYGPDPYAHVLRYNGF